MLKHPAVAATHEEAERLAEETGAVLVPGVVPVPSLEDFREVWFAHKKSATYGLGLDSELITASWETLKTMDPAGAGRWDPDGVVLTVESYRSGADGTTIGVGLGGIGGGRDEWAWWKSSTGQSITGKPVVLSDEAAAYVVALQPEGVGAEYRYVELWNPTPGGKHVHVPLFSGDVLQFKSSVGYRIRTPRTKRKDHKRQQRMYLVFSYHGGKALACEESVVAAPVPTPSPAMEATDVEMPRPATPSSEVEAKMPKAQVAQPVAQEPEKKLQPIIENTPAAHVLEYRKKFFDVIWESPDKKHERIKLWIVSSGMLPMDPEEWVETINDFEEIHKAVIEKHGLEVSPIPCLCFVDDELNEITQTGRARLPLV